MKKAKQLFGTKIRASDGDIGHIEDLFFDDYAWTVRYLVVDTGIWILGRKVLISPESVADTNGTVKLTLTRKQIRESPDVNTDKPVSRQMEEELSRHYNWPIYWGRMGKAIAEDEGVQQEESPPGGGDPNLRSAKEIIGYYLHALDGDMGYVHDILVDEQGWKIRYIEADSGEWLAGRKTLLSPWWLKEIQWGRRCLCVDTNKKTVQQSPPYDPEKIPDRDYEHKLFTHYGKAAYWE